MDLIAVSVGNRLDFVSGSKVNAEFMASPLILHKNDELLMINYKLLKLVETRGDAHRSVLTTLAAVAVFMPSMLGGLSQTLTTGSIGGIIEYEVLALRAVFELMMNYK